MRRDPRSPEIPYITGLDGYAEDFLYSSKNFLRDLTKVLQIAFDCPLDEASAFGDLKGNGASEVVKWAADKFGQSDHLVALLQSDCDWITELARKRNAREHPGKKSGSLTVHNIRLHESGNGLVPPTWHRTGLDEMDLIQEIEVLLFNMLTLAEDVLADTVMKTALFPFLIVRQIPEQVRDPRNPYRLSMAMRPPTSTHAVRQLPARIKPFGVKKGDPEQA